MSLTSSSTTSMFQPLWMSLIHHSFTKKCINYLVIENQVKRNGLFQDQELLKLQGLGQGLQWRPQVGLDRLLDVRVHPDQKLADQLVDRAHNVIWLCVSSTLGEQAYMRVNRVSKSQLRQISAQMHSEFHLLILQMQNIVLHMLDPHGKVQTNTIISWNALKNRNCIV